MVVRIIPEASRVLETSQSPLRPTALFDLHGHCGRCGGNAAVVSWPKVPGPTHCPVIVSQVVDGNQANWPFPKFTQENLANKDIHHSLCSPGLLSRRNSESLHSYKLI